jgi:hypothetical protein
MSIKNFEDKFIQAENDTFQKGNFEDWHFGFNRKISSRYK